MTATACLCPNCGTELTVTLTARPAAQRAPQERESALIEPCLIADRLRLSEAYVRKLIRRGLNQALPDFEKRGGRLFADPEAVKEIWSG